MSKNCSSIKDKSSNGGNKYVVSNSNTNNELLKMKDKTTERNCSLKSESYQENIPPTFTNSKRKKSSDSRRSLVGKKCQIGVSGSGRDVRLLLNSNSKSKKSVYPFFN